METYRNNDPLIALYENIVTCFGIKYLHIPERIFEDYKLGYYRTLKGALRELKREGDYLALNSELPISFNISSNIENIKFQGENDATKTNLFTYKFNDQGLYNLYIILGSKDNKYSVTSTNFMASKLVGYNNLLRFAIHSQCAMHVMHDTLKNKNKMDNKYFQLNVCNEDLKKRFLVDGFFLNYSSSIDEKVLEITHAMKNLLSKVLQDPKTLQDPLPTIS